MKRQDNVVEEDICNMKDGNALIKCCKNGLMAWVR